MDIVTLGAALNGSKVYTDQVTQSLMGEVDVLLAPEQAKTVGMSEGGSNYITVGGIRVYVSATVPTGTIPDGSIGFGW